MSNRVIVADLHLDNDPLTEYRWKVFEVISNLAEEIGADYVDILGDLTERKDKHPSSLVNKIADEVLKLSQISCVRILKGNHDYVDEKEPYFEFLEQIQNVLYFSENESHGNTLFLPHSKNFMFPDKIGMEIKYIYMHQPIIGAVTQNGYILEDGITVPNINGIKIYSGDIHTPQTIKGVTYIGSPYHVYAGDVYSGRIISIQDGKEHKHLTNDLFPSLWSLYLNNDDLSDKWYHEIKRGDHLKIKVNLEKSEYHEWEKIKKDIKSICENNGIILTSLEMKPVQNNTPIKEEEIKLTLDTDYKAIIDKYAEKEKLDAEFVNAAYDMVI